MLENIPIFSGLEAEDLNKLSERAVTKRFPKGAVLINEGDPTDSLYIIVEGRAKIYLSDEEGKEVILRILGPGDYFGELSLLDAAPRSASAMTMEPTRCSIISKASFDEVLAEHPGMVQGVIQSLTRRVRASTDDVRNLALLDVYGRIARTLLDMASESPEEEGKLVVPHRLTHQDLANMVGASREMVTRILKDLADGGYISVKNRQITINEKLPPGW